MKPDSDLIRLPGPTSRTAIVGRTGSGKTLAAIWHLSQANFDERPFVIIDYKDDETINSINGLIEIDYETVPEFPGIYVLKVLPGEEKELSGWFYRAWNRQNIGIYVDEGYMVDPRDKWFNACLTQGRSRNIQMIILSQRPVWLSRFVFSEADFFQIFDLTHTKDMDKVREYIRDDDRNQLEKPLDDFNSYYYDVARRQLETFKPVPQAKQLVSTINRRLEALAEDYPRRMAI